MFFASRSIATSASGSPLDDDKVGELALFDRAQIGARPKHSAAQPVAARIACIGVIPALDQAGDLVGIGRVAVAAGVGAGDDLDPGGERARGSRRGARRVVRPLADMRLRRFAVVFVDQQGRHKNDAALRHPVEMARVLVEIAAVVDRIDAGLDRDVEPAAAQRMADHPAVERMRLLDQRLHLVEVEGAVARAVARARAGAAGRRAFDDVGAGAHHAPHHRADIGEAVSTTPLGNSGSPGTQHGNRPTG